MNTRGLLRIISLISLIGLVGCDIGATSNAQEIIKKGLRAPSTFSAVSSEQVWKGRSSAGHDAFIVRVEYDAQNGFGAIIRDCKFVAFSTNGSEMTWKTQGALATCDNNAAFEKSTVDGMRRYNFGA